MRVSGPTRIFPFVSPSTVSGVAKRWSFSFAGGVARLHVALDLDVDLLAGVRADLLLQHVPVLHRVAVDGEDAVAVRDAGLRRRAARRHAHAHARLVDHGVTAEEEREEDEDRREEVVRERARGDRDDARPERGVRVALRILRVDVLVRVHARDLHVGEERDDRDLEGRRAVLGAVLPERRTEADRELRHAHAEATRRQVVPAFVDHHQDGKPEDGDQRVRKRHGLQLSGKESLRPWLRVRAEGAGESARSRSVYRGTCANPC